MSDVIIQIKRVLTGEIRNARDSLCELINLTEEYPFFMWEDGNWACDCNRASFFWEDDTSIFPIDHHFPCDGGDDTYEVRIIDKITNEVLYDEWDEEQDITNFEKSLNPEKFADEKKDH